NKAPKTYVFIDLLEKCLLKVDASEANEVDLSWKNVKGAISYEVYRDGELIHTTTSNKFKDTDFAQSGNYEYTVKAIGNADELYSTFPRNIDVEVDELEEPQEENIDAPTNLQTNTE